MIVEQPGSRERQTFSCTAEVWDAAKQAWVSAQADYPAWTDWVESAIAEATQRALAAGGGQLASAPSRIPSGRRPGDAGPPRPRRSFTCRPDIWQAARDAWWTNRQTHPNLSDWLQSALAAKAGHVQTAAKGQHDGT